MTAINITGPHMPHWFLFKLHGDQQLAIAHSAVWLATQEHSVDENHGLAIAFGDHLPDTGKVPTIVTDASHIFGRLQQVKLGKPSAVKANAKPSTTLTGANPPVDVFGFLPLVGREICTLMTEGLYPA